MNIEREFALCFKTFHKVAMTQFDSNIRILLNDNGMDIKKVTSKIICVIMEIITKQVLLNLLIQLLRME